MCSSFERLLIKENEQGRRKGKIEGEVNGRAKAVIELLGELGEPSDALRNQIMEQKDVKVLGNWLKIAAKSESIEAFEEAVGLVQLQ